MELFFGWWAAAILINTFKDGKSKRSNTLSFIAFDSGPMPETLVVDCSHTNAKQLTHHLKGPNQKKMMDLSLRGDSSTDAVLNSIIRESEFTKGLKYVTSNHFDVDSFTASWCCSYPDLAEKHEKIIREISLIGDFRELRLDHSYQHTALKLTCWLNSEERRLFYKPFESKISVANGELDGVAKFEYFLPRFADVLENPEKYEEQWIEEYDRVVKEYAVVNSSPTYSDKKSGIIVVDLIDPTHYYSLFSISRAYDIIMASYSRNRYEVEIKYTSMIDLGSRPTLPRVDMTPLALYLDKLEKSKKSNMQVHDNDKDIGQEKVEVKEFHEVKKEKEMISVEGDGEQFMSIHNDKTKGEVQDELCETFKWQCDRITDSGPLLRLNSNINKLSKAARYGHPYERPIYSSLISPLEMKKIVLSFFSHAYVRESGPVRATMDHEWSDLHEFNKNINWDTWKPPL